MRIVLKLISGAALIGSVVWFITAPSLEPVVTSLGALASLIGLFLTEHSTQKTKETQQREEESQEQVDSQLVEWSDVIMNYAYYFDRDGRRSFFPIDIAADWINAYRKFLSDGEITSSKDTLMSGLPMKVEPETGLQELDDDAISSVFDYLVIKGYLTRAKHIAFREKYEITDKGKFYFANKFLRSDAKR